MNSFVTAWLGVHISRWWGGHRTIDTALVYAAVAALLAIPVLIAEVPLGVDDLNHLARIYVRAHINSDPDLARLFEIRAEVIPYLGMDLLLTPLARVLPIMLVGRIYILALVWGFVGTVVVLQRAFTSRTDLGPAVAGLIAYNGLLAWGLINYVLGLILALLLFAAWHSQRARFWSVRLILFTGAATVLYLTHLLAFMLYGVLVVSYELFGRAQPWRTPLRDWVVLAGQAIPGLVLWSALSIKIPNADLAIHYRTTAKLLALDSPFLFRGAAGGLDTGLLVVCCCVAALCLGVWRGWLTWPRTLAAPVVVLLALTVMLPFRMLGVSLVDYRFAVAAACLALAGLRLTAPALPHTLATAALVLLTVAHMADVSALMQRCDGQYSELRDAMAALPRGAELATVLERTEPRPGIACTTLPIYEHIAQLVTIDRSGYAPDFFANVTSVSVRDGRRTDTDPTSADKFTAAPAAGYVLWIHLGHPRPVPTGLVLFRRGTFFDLWTATRDHADADFTALRHAPQKQLQGGAQDAAHTRSAPAPLGH
jgi:hypothetical protein